MTQTIEKPQPAAVGVHDPARARRAVVAAALGNALEWYDVVLFAFLASTMSAVFYPGKGLAADLMTWATFAITFAVRPLGAVLIGHYSDKHGRKNALSLTIGLMTLGVFIIVVLPGYGTIGILAPIVLIIARIIQGISAGGEFGSATAFMTENAAKNKNFYASWQVATQGLSMLMAAGVSWFITATLPREDVLTWGWRVAFAIGLLIGPVGWWVRTKMDDTPEFEAAESDHAPVKVLLSEHLGRLGASFAIIGMATLSVYLITYLPSYAVKTLHLPSWSAYPGAVVAGLMTLIGSPLVGRLADRVGATTIMIPAAIAGVIAGIPMFAVLRSHPTVLTLTLCEMVVGLFMCLYFAPMPGLLSEMFPVQVRGSGMTIAYSLGVALLGGIAPLLLDWLVAGRHVMLAPAYYYMAMCALSLVGSLLSRVRYANI